MADTDPNEFVYIKHPKVDAIGGPVTRRALDEVHSARGWKEAKPGDVEAAVAADDTTTTPKGN